MTSQVKSDDKTLERVYQEASQWVRFANTVVWSMGTLLVPVSFGFVGVTLNNSGTKFSLTGKAILGAGSIFLFSFWVYASSFYKRSSDVARRLLIEIEGIWGLDKAKMSLYGLQEEVLIKRFRPFEYKSFRRFWKLYSLEVKSGLYRLQMVTLVALIAIWVLILCFNL